MDPYMLQVPSVESFFILRHYRSTLWTIRAVLSHVHSTKPSDEPVRFLPEADRNRFPASNQKVFPIIPTSNWKHWSLFSQLGWRQQEWFKRQSTCCKQRPCGSCSWLLWPWNRPANVEYLSSGHIPSPALLLTITIAQINARVRRAARPRNLGPLRVHNDGSAAYSRVPIHPSGSNTSKPSCHLMLQICIPTPLLKIGGMYESNAIVCINCYAIRSVVVSVSSSPRVFQGNRELTTLSRIIYCTAQKRCVGFSVKRVSHVHGRDFTYH